jgi:hypothetical protein
MQSAFPDINIKRLFKQTVILSSILFSLLTALPEALAQPVVLGAGMNTDKTVWAFDRDVRDANKEVTFWFRVQKQSIVNRFGTFDYYLNPWHALCGLVHAAKIGLYPSIFGTPYGKVTAIWETAERSTHLTC